jgi:hypothetical protein
VAERDGRRVLLPWKSISGPSLAPDPGLYSPGTGRRLFLAWTGADSSIYISWCNYGAIDEFLDPSRLQRIETDSIPERTFTAPTLAFSGNQLYVGWAGNDSQHRVNFKVLLGPNAGRKVTLSQTASPAIGMETFNGATYTGRYAYRGTDGVGGLYVGEPMPL